MGYAWIGVTCAKSILNQGNVYYGGTAVSSYMGTGSYRLVAHEVGHNFGAEHTADGKFHSLHFTPILHKSIKHW